MTDNWKEDQLDRKSSAKFLTDYLNEKYQSQIHSPRNLGFVLNLNAEWGFGKSFFIERWAKRYPISL